MLYSNSSVHGVPHSFRRSVGRAEWDYAPSILLQVRKFTSFFHAISSDSQMFFGSVRGMPHVPGRTQRHLRPATCRSLQQFADAIVCLTYTESDMVDLRSDRRSGSRTQLL